MIAPPLVLAALALEAPNTGSDPLPPLTATIVGMVVRREDGYPLSGAEVALVEGFAWHRLTASAA